MSDAPSTTDAPATTETTETAPDTGEQTDWKAEAEKWQSLARKHEDRAKTNSSAAKELEQLRQQTMTDTEKAIAEARAEARKEAMSEVGSRLVDSEIRVAAGGRLGKDQLDVLLQGLDRAKFLTEEGEVDAKSVTRFVDGIAPAQQDKPSFDLGQGARGGTLPLNGDPLLNAVKGKLGI